MTSGAYFGPNGTIAGDRLPLIMRAKEATLADHLRVAPPTPLDDYFAAAWLTSDLTFETRHKLATIGHLAAIEEGQVMLREGEPTESLALVIEGRVALRLHVPERGRITILTVEPGDVVGWTAIVAPYRATSTAVAVAPTTLIRFDAAELREALAGDVDLAAAFYPPLLGAVARRLEGTRLQLLDLFNERWVEPW